MPTGKLRSFSFGYSRPVFQTGCLMLFDRPLIIVAAGRFRFGAAAPERKAQCPHLVPIDSEKMTGQDDPSHNINWVGSVEESNEPGEFVVFPAEAVKYLPKEWQEHFYILIGEGQAVLESADENLRILNRIVHSFPTMASLRYIQHRLASTVFKATEEWMLENEMLTLAFVTTYARLIDGGVGSGVSRSALPVELRLVHDNIIELRNKRYAHNTGHHSVAGNLEIDFKAGKFDIQMNFHMDFHVGGALEWEPLVVFLDGLMFSRLQTQLERLREKTGRDWTFPSGAPPKWVRSDL